MSIRWADFPSGDTGLYGTTTSLMLSGIWAETSSGTSIIEDPDPNTTGNVLLCSGSRCRYVLPSAQNTVGIAARVWLPSIPSTNATRPAIFQWRDGSNNVSLAVLVSPTGSLQVIRDVNFTGGTSTQIGETAGPVMTASAWRHVEIKVLWSTTVGTVTIKVEGVEVLALTGVNTGAANYAQVAVGVSYSLVAVSFSTYFKDIVFWDGSGSVNNDFLSTVGVYYLRPTADVSTGWSRTSGSTDWELLNESPPNDSGYIYAGDPPPAPSILNVEELPADIVGVRAILPVARAAKSDSGDGNLQMSVSPNGTDWDAGADNAVSTAFTYYYDVSEVSPDTAAAWTPVEVNALEFELNRTV